jgi:hypothetical protein
MDFDEVVCDSDGESRCLPSFDSSPPVQLNCIKLRAMSINEPILESDVKAPWSITAAKKSKHAPYGRRLLRKNFSHCLNREPYLLWMITTRRSYAVRM